MNIKIYTLMNQEEFQFLLVFMNMILLNGNLINKFSYIELLTKFEQTINIPLVKKDNKKRNRVFLCHWWKIFIFLSNYIFKSNFK